MSAKMSAKMSDSLNRQARSWKNWGGAAFAAIWGIVGALALLSACAMAPRPVFYGSGDEFDACGSTGEGRLVAGETLAVHSAPSANAPVIYRLSSGEGFWLCDGSAQGEWTGIVVYEGFDGNAGQGPSDDCGAAFNVPVRQPYRGPCLSGWVRSARVLLIAG